MNSLTTLILWVFLSSLALTTFIINGVEASHNVYMHLQSSPAPANVNQLHRTGYHFQPPRNWINGPMYYNGIYHLFYQYNPKGAVWGNIVWAHSVHNPPRKQARYSLTGIVDENNTQVQNYAVPANLSDPYLREWIKPDNNPLIVADKSINKTAFRDPTTAWLGRDGHWRLSIGGRRKDRGIAYLYRSKDFMHWVKAKHPLHSTARTGNWECPDFFPVSVSGKNGLETSVMDPNVKHVLKVSLDVTRYEYYTLGTYKNDKYIPDKNMIDGWNGLRYDYGNFYASKSFFDPSKNRRILWGWANESSSTADDIKKGWAGIQLIPRTVLLDSSGKQLVQWPIEEVETLRGKKVELKKQKLVKGQRVEIKGITAAQADVDVTFSFDSLDKAEPFDPSWDRHDAQKLCSHKGSTVQGGLGPFGLLTLASKNLEEYTPVFFRVFRDQDKYLVLMCSDASRSTLRNGAGAYRPSFAGFVDVDLTEKKLSLRSLIDNSVVESFGARGKTCISSRVYPTLAVYNNAHLYAFNNGTQTVKIDSLNAWSMNRPLEMN
ncbi:UNVERIFIED_CONTAM: Beta-fructofuranosidase, insoluble isoenzyme 1 [Sesamum latifolium]|uniref:Beta-fructofuranosidase, insoluble isoenzyme 1 n=1 Tax=Sesamum latifolium TaxID=2727402 RepID=A0AAW2VBW3_9LAMI